MKKTVFTNGCFDILHPGHIDLLKRARRLGDRLIVGLNSDDSAKSIKGLNRPFMNQEDRKKVLEGLADVDEVVLFDELTPDRLIREIKPQVLVKGGDWSEDEIVGSEFVRSIGGEVYSLPLVDGYSSSTIIKKLQSSEADTIAGHGFDSLDEHIGVFQKIKSGLSENILRAGDILVETFRNKKKVLIFG